MSEQMANPAEEGRGQAGASQDSATLRTLRTKLRQRNRASETNRLSKGGDGTAVGNGGAHVILRGAALVLRAERGPGAPEAIYGAACLVCEAESGLADDDPKPIEVWALEHTRGAGPEHCQYLVTTQKHWRVDPVRPPSRAAPGPAAPRERRARPGEVQARVPGSRPGWRAVFGPLRPWTARVGRAVDPQLLSGLALCSVLCGVRPTAARARHVRTVASHTRRDA